MSQKRSLDGVLIKKANKQETYNDDQVNEFLKCLDSETGYLHFVKNYFYIQHPVKGKIKFEPFEYQERLMESYHKYKYNINMLPRQSGKTTCAAGYLLWYAMFHPDQTILIAAHKFTGAQEIMQRIRYAYEDCPDFIRAGVVSYNKGSIEFDNGSRIVSATTTGNTGRGMSISLLYCDEFAFLQPNIAEEFWTSISPTLATGGRAIITSTPNSDEDTFATIWKEANKKFDEFGNESDVGVNGFHSFIAHWYEHPDRDENWKKTELGRIGEEKFRREFGCEFLVYDETLINSLVLSSLEGVDPIMKMGQVRWYKKPVDDMIYVVALDPALGTGGNNAAIQVLEMPSMIQVAEWCHNLTPIEGQIKILRDINKFIVDCCPKSNGTNLYWSVENNSLGEAALVSIKNVGEENIPGLFVSEPIRKGHVRKFRKGFNTTHKTKISACARLKHMVESGKMKINSKMLVTELKAFIAAGVTFKAKVGETDDLVLSLILAMRINAVLSDWDHRVFEVMTHTGYDDFEEWEPPMPIFVSTRL